MERLMTIDEVAEILAVPKTWLYAASKRGQFPCVRMGKYVRFRPSDVQKWIETGGQGFDEQNLL